MKRISLLVTLIVFISTVMYCQIPSDRDVLLNGEGAGQGTFAEKNGYPGPKHVLDLAKQLNLSETQTKAVSKIYQDMLSRAKELGKTIVQSEEDLDHAFADNLVSESSVQASAEQIGKLRGKLRSIHLNAHLKTQSLLTSDQLAQYKKLRASASTQQSKK